MASPLTSLVGPLSDLSPWVFRGAALVVLELLYLIYIREATPLRKVPGPFLASLTQLWVFNKTRGFKRPLVDIELHEKYGPIVRTSPTEVLISSPKAFRTVYGAGSNFSKGEWYRATGDEGWTDPESLDFLAEKNMEKYRRQRRAIGPAYTEHAMREYEPRIDEAVQKDIDIMHQRAGESVDIDVFLNLFASDCLSMATFSKTKNLVELGKDDGSVHYIHDAWKYMHIVGFYPSVHRLLSWSNNSPRVVWLKAAVLSILPRLGRTKPTASNPFTFPIGQFMERSALMKDASVEHDRSSDIAAKLFDLQSEKGSLSEAWIRGICMTNYGAGVETIAITVATLIDNVVTYPGCQKRIHAEIDAAKKAGKLSTPPKLREMKDHLPYLSACMNESQRIHPVVGMPLVRVVPDGGVELEGKFLPGGTTVGINPWVLSRNKDLYGEDADIWRPERWLECSDEKLKFLETYNISFGTGARSCPGKHLAQAIYTKMIPMLFSDFEWSFTDSLAGKKLQCTFSVRYIGLMMQWKLRDERKEAW